MAYKSIDNIQTIYDFSNDKYQNSTYEFIITSKKDQRQMKIQCIGTSQAVVEQYIRKELNRSFLIEAVNL